MAMALLLGRRKAAGVVLQRDALPACTRCLVRSVKQGGKGKKNTDYKRVDPPPPPRGDGSRASDGRRKNLFDILAFLPDWGLGMKFQKKTWRRDRFFVLTGLKLNNSLNHGTAWGVFHENGEAKTGIMRIGGGNKRKWRMAEKPRVEYIPWKRLIHAEPKRKAAIMQRRAKRKTSYLARKAEAPPAITENGSV